MHVNGSQLPLLNKSNTRSHRISDNKLRNSESLSGIVSLLLLLILTLNLITCSGSDRSQETSENSGGSELNPQTTSPENRSDRPWGLISGPGFEIVKANCTGCHSSNLIVQSRQDRDGWKETIRWMQSEQGLWQFDEQTEQIILDYLSTYYSPESPKSPRRAPLKIE